MGGFRPRALIFACLVSGTLFSCAPSKVDLRTGPRAYEPEDYKAILRRWSRTERLNTIEAMDNVLTVTSTYESWDFRWAFTRRYAEDYRLSPDQALRLRDQSLAESEQIHSFYVALFADDQRSGDLTEKEPAWIARLVDDQGTETEPLHIDALKRPGAVERAYYPYTSVWRTAYRITFPRTVGGKPTIRPGAKWFGLRFAGPAGKTTLVWEVESTP
jgi:hypothetical protein